MKSLIYSQFQECFDKKETELLDAFKEKAFWEELKPEDKERLARLFLLKAERLQQGNEKSDEDLQQEILNILQCVEELTPHSPEMLCRSAALLLYSGRISQDIQFLFLAIKKLKTAEGIDPGFFEVFFEWSHLWGNILVALSMVASEEEVLEKALEKFDKAATLLKKEKEYSSNARDLYWDWAEAWILLGTRSGELSDLLQGIEKFQEAARLGCDLPHFRIDFGEALLQVGLIRGDPKELRGALDLFKEAVALCLMHESIPQAALRKGWSNIVKTSLKLAEMSATEEDFRAADQLIHEAILAVPTQAEFWLDWGSLYLTHGWIYKTAGSIEIALEKLTSSKIPECNPLQVSSLLGEGLVLLGLFLEDLKLIKEGEKRLLETLKFAPEDPSLLYGAGLASLALGLYFSEEKYFQASVEWFQKGILHSASSYKLWQGVFQAYLSWGALHGNTWIFRKAIAAAGRLVELRPASPHHWCQWGIGYLRLYQLEKENFVWLEEGAAKIRKAVELREEDPEPDWLFYYACALDLLGDHYGDESYYEQAASLFSKVLEKVPQAANVRYHLALALSHHGEATGDIESLQRAHELFQSFVKDDEEDDTAWCEWGYVLLNLSELILDPLRPEEGETLRSLAEMKLVRATELGNGIAHYHLTCLYALAGLDEAALRSLKKAELNDALPSLEDLEKDEWLEGIRSSVSFQEFLSSRKQQESDI